MLFPVLGEENDVVDEQFHSSKPLRTRNMIDWNHPGEEEMLVTSLSIPTVHLG